LVINLALVILKQFDQEFLCGALAGAAGPQKTEDFPLLYFKVYIVDSKVLVIGVLEIESLYLKQWQSLL
jgi:hypothetical protein